MKALGYCKTTLGATTHDFMEFWKPLTREQKDKMLNEARIDAKASGITLEDAEVDGS